MHKTVQAYMDTLHARQGESNLTMTMLHDIPTFDGQDSSKLENWFMHIETATDFLTERCTCLTKAKSCGLTCMLICKPIQTGKCWDEVKGTIRLKLCNANIHTSRFMEIQQKDSKTLAVYVHCFKTEAKQCAFDNDTAATASLLKALKMHPLLHPEYMRRTPKLWLKSSNLLRNSIQHTN